MQQQKPPPPPRSRKTAKRIAPHFMRESDKTLSDDDHSYATYPLRNEFGRHEHSSEEPPQSPLTVLDREPETIIGETLEIKGRLKFERLLRLDGSFEGELVSEGDLVVGPSGEIRGDLNRMKDVVVFGKVIGNIQVDSLDLCGAASVYGSITCRTCRIDPTVVLVGTLNINPHAPQLMNKDGTLVPLPDSGESHDNDTKTEQQPPRERDANSNEKDGGDLQQQQEETPQTPQAQAEPSVKNDVAAAAPSSAAASAPITKDETPDDAAFADGVGEVPRDEPETAASGEKADASEIAKEEPPPENDSAGSSTTGADGADKGEEGAT